MGLDLGLIAFRISAAENHRAIFAHTDFTMAFGFQERKFFVARCKGGQGDAPSELKDFPSNPMWSQAILAVSGDGTCILKSS